VGINQAILGSDGGGSAQTDAVTTWLFSAGGLLVGLAASTWLAARAVGMTLNECAIKVSEQRGFGAVWPEHIPDNIFYRFHRIEICWGLIFTASVFGIALLEAA